MVTWPVMLMQRRGDGSTIRLRALTSGDRAEWDQLRRDNRDWLTPWESTLPTGPEPAVTFRRLRRGYNRAAREGRLLPFVVELDEVLVGQMHLFDISWGSRWGGAAGYWLARSATGRGVATWALAMLIDYAIGDVGLHRIEVNIRPENVASLAVVHRLGMREEGLRPGLIHVDGQWRDHRTFAVTADEVAMDGWFVDRLRLTDTSSGR